MDFGIDKDTQALLERFRGFMDQHVLPLEPKLAGQRFVDVAPELERVRAEVKKEGLWTPQMPEEHGGMGLSFRQHSLVSEVLGRSPIGHYCFNFQAPDAGNMEILAKYGTPEQKERWLAPLVRGEIRSCFSMTEPDRAGSNPTWLDTMAARDGDDYVINGRKWFTSSADGASFAVVMAVTNADATAHLRASQIIVPTDNAGFVHVRLISVMGHQGSGWASHSEVEYRDCRVPVANRLGEEGAGFLIAQERLGPGRIHHCMRWMGIAERAFEMMCDRAVKREYAPGKPLGTRQMIQDFIAESRADIDAAKLLIQKAAWRIDTEGLYAARNDISIIKFHAANALGRVLDRAIQVHGALGVTDDTPLASWYAHERSARIYDGPDEVHKSAVARRILRQRGLTTR